MCPKRTTYSYDALGRVTQIDHDADNPSLIGQDYRFVYDNGDGAVACGIVGSTCAYRKGRLALARLEATPGVFWDLEQDYAQDGQVSAERWPSSRQTGYTFGAQGRLVRITLLGRQPPWPARRRQRGREPAARDAGLCQLECSTTISR